jgi:glyoxylase-like metal-dependent hydrolase (beta-lactamase superfamily II)/predicted ester cyclase
MASSSVIAKRYFAALTLRDIDAAVDCWAPGGVERMIGQGDLAAPEGIHDYFATLFDAFPDFTFEVIDTTTQRERCTVRWRATGTFIGPGRFQGFTPNGARVAIEGCDVVEVVDDLIVSNEAYVDSGDVARQLGILPAAGSKAESRLATLANTRTWAGKALYGVEAEAIAAGVWILRGGRPRVMNVYLIEDEGGVTVFDSGVVQMNRSIMAAAARFGGIRRVVLSHADADHRGGAAALKAPVYCHALERSAAQSPSPYRDYWNLSLLSRWSRPAFQRLMANWDGGAVKVEGTVEDGESIAGFKVVHLPGHAPGLIGLFREEDGLALASDCVLTINPETGLGRAAQVAPPAVNYDTNQARDSIRKLATLGPKVVWAGHKKPVSGDDIELQLQRAASAAV